MSRRPSLRHLLLGVNLSILFVPLIAVFLLPLADAYLTRQTERSLISQSVLIGEAWRDRWLAAKGLSPALAPVSDAEESAASFRPPGHADERYVPIEPTLDLTYRVLPPAEPGRPRPPGTLPDRAALSAGLAVTPMLHRAKVFILSGARVLDPEGCIVATSRDGLGECLGHLEEVRSALAGSYRAVVRQRVSDEPPPPLTSIRRRGRLRVFVATPIFHDGGVIGAIWMSRTSQSPLEILWAHRGKVALILVLYLTVLPPATYFLSHQISKPVRALTRRAEATARGEPAPEFEPGRLAPREVITLSDAFERMASQLTNRASSIEEFARNASHELKTPITAISGAVELLQDEAESMSPEQRRRFLANIAADAERMERLVTRLLHLARVQSEPEEVESVDVGATLSEVLAGYREAIELDVEPDLPASLMVRDHLETAVRNLVDNAIRHGGGKSIRVRARRRGPRVEIAVRDAGPGISPANREQIFERFFTTARGSGGTGLGLAIVRAVADARGGSVEFDSGPERTEFRLIV
jgi:signal transduction histidine kinase